MEDEERNTLRNSKVILKLVNYYFDFEGWSPLPRTICTASEVTQTPCALAMLVITRMNLLYGAYSARDRRN